MSYVQDTVHLGVKLKARLLTYSQILPLGKYSAQPSHLSLLQASFYKEQHNLCAKDLAKFILFNVRREKPYYYFPLNKFKMPQLFLVHCILTTATLTSIELASPTTSPFSTS